MKILPHLTVIQGQKQAVRRSRTESDKVFKVEEPADPKETSQEAVDVVSLENRRASRPAPPRDLGAAEALLRTVKGGLSNLKHEDLGKIHRLEGLVHFYTP
jgi:hypothetical protein